LQFFVNDAVKFRIGIEDDKTKNSTLRKTLQGIKNDRRSKHTRAVASIDSNNEISGHNSPKAGTNGEAITKQHDNIGEPQFNDGSDLHNAQGPLKRVGWKLELCRFGGLFEEAISAYELNRGLSDNVKQHDRESNDLIFSKKDDESIVDVIKCNTRLPH
jgi:hypothetical protein